MAFPISSRLKDGLQGQRDRYRALRRSVGNARRAFHPNEFGYRLAIGRHGGFRVAYRSGTADEAVIQHSFENDIFFPAIPEYEPAQGDVILDVGAHIGTFALLAARKVVSGRVFAIEASQETFDYLQINIALNGLGNVEASHVALGGVSGRTVLYHDRGNWGHSIMKQLSSVGEYVDALTLADYMEEHCIERCALAKFNCEGAEFPILLSASEDTLARIDNMLVLYHCDIADGYDVDGLTAHLRAQGYRIELRNREGFRGWIVAQRQSG